MNALVRPIIAWSQSILRGWDQFWFTPAPPHTLALIRILGGSMLLYTHAVWSINLNAFLGPNSWLTSDAASLMNRDLDGRNFALSYLYFVNSPALLWTLHVAALVVFAMLTVGFFTRVTAVLAWIVTLSYCHRLTGTLFGLDQINAFIATYLMLGDSGGVCSVDRWLVRRRGRELPVRKTVGTNIAIRCLQLHMCVIYLFGGIGKMRGEMWWDGSALWFAFASLEYQSFDMTWMVRHRWLLALLTHVTVFWETFYCFLIWPKLTRPICLAMAVLVHLGIAVCLGMKTFGLVMIIANLAFVYPETVRGVVSWFAARASGASPSPANVAHPAASRERSPMSRWQAPAETTVA
jgi:uncharacterized membrane protein YphA (DoxX/SURF4 family)